MDKVIENWDKILQTVKADYDVGDVAFNTWLKPLKVYDVRGSCDHDSGTIRAGCFNKSS